MPIRDARVAVAAKRVTDIVLSALLLVMFAPLFLVCAVLIRRSGAGIFYSDRRVGRNGRIFYCHKFRTMVPNANAHLSALLARDPELRREWETSFKLKHDPRVTAIGRFLRKTSLDELPQLLNVLKGEMSLVGPRPMFEEEQVRWGAAIHYYYSTRPGMTGVWQIYGRSDTDYETRIRLNVEYVRHWSYWRDIVLLAVTPRVFFVRSGAY
ncbi:MULTISPECIES: sugar transferase [Inquilinus]|uniref:Lipopolysaccharide/colanic/teichoic acid biosynthesis glycosyltransferase n=1 Tax=Inquilinus ginsengisoli TaxID=363840 RepID=A0ABU1JMR7_9PROT|nr:sugar transferase [Inquilinus ginsengisoli]MDR6289912.1 lipopolysaccharide/colanic/teichoic acid biosynthesis glycosyltransferase [Inquilinus ginsengisoli]